MSLAVSAELRAALARRGYNVQQFADHSKMPLSTLHKTLKGHRVVDVEDVFAICEALGIHPGTLIDDAADAARSGLTSLISADREGEPEGFERPDVRPSTLERLNAEADADSRSSADDTSAPVADLDAYRDLTSEPVDEGADDELAAAKDRGPEETPDSLFDGA